LPPVSTTPAANNYQTADNLKWTWIKKIYLFANSTTQKCPKEIIFLMEDFFHLPPLSTTLVVHLALRISPRVFKKIWNGLTGIIRCLGETDPCRKLEVRNLMATVPLRSLS
jgi:hypothetical protein